MASDLAIPTPDTEAPPRGRLRARLDEPDNYGVVLLLILATILTLSFGPGVVQVASVGLSGFTLLFVLHTSGARRRVVRAASVVVVVAVAGAAAALLTGASWGTDAAGLVGLLLAFAAPLVILRRIVQSESITIRLVLGALATYLLLGLTYAYLYPVSHLVTHEPFFAQTTSPHAIDYLYFSYVTLTTVGYGDLTAATSVGGMMAVSEALIGQLYLVSVVALLVGNIGRKVARRTPATGIDVDSAVASEAAEPGPPPRLDERR